MNLIEAKNMLSIQILLTLSIATSIDALAVGITFGFFKLPIVNPVIRRASDPSLMTDAYDRSYTKTDNIIHIITKIRLAITFSFSPKTPWL